MNSVTVFCGNGGDYEYERDRARWELWINKHISGCWTVGHVTVGFKIIPHRDADKAIIEFDVPDNATLFALKCPKTHKELVNALFKSNTII